MAIAEARSRYVLDDSASPALRGIRREATRTTEALRGTERALDRIGSPSQLQRLERLEGRFRRVADGAEAMHRRVDQAGRHMEGSIRTSTLRAEGRLEGFDRKLREVGSLTATPSVNLDGVAEARAELAYLQRDLRKFGRQNAVATARVRTTGGGMPGGGMPGGGGGSGNPLSGGFSVPGLGRVPVAAAAAALPTGVALLGGAGALLGSAGAGALGAGAIGATGLGAGAVGAAGIASVAIPAVKGLKAATQAQKQYNQAVDTYGRTSKQAETAKKRLDVALAHAPAGGARLLREAHALSVDWRKASAPAQGQLTGLAGNLVSDVRSQVPALSRDALTVTTAANRQGSNFGDFLTGQRNLTTIRELSHTFANNLDEAERTGEHLVGTFGNIARASRPFFHEGMVFLDHWTGRWEKSTHDIGNTRREIGTMVDDLKAWGRLAGAAAKLTRDVLNPGRKPGRSMVEDLTGTLDRWDTWAQRNPRKIESFFDRTVSATEKLATALGSVVSLLGKVGDVLLPALNGASQLATLAGASGLLFPGALSLGIGGFRGGRAALRGPAGGGGGEGVALAAGAALGGGAPLRGAAAGGAGLPAGLALMGGAAAARGPGRIGSTIGAFRSGYGRFSEYGRLRGVAGGIAEATPIGSGIARGIVGGAAKRYLPIAAVLGLLSGIGYNGGTGDKILQGAHAALPFIPGPGPDRAAQADRGQRIAEDFIGSHTGGGAPPANRIQAGRQYSDVSGRLLTAKLTRSEMDTKATGPMGWVQQNGGGRVRARIDGKEFTTSELDAYIGRLQKEVGVRKQLVAQLDKEAHATKALRQSQRGKDALLDIAKSYDILKRKLGSGAAFRDFEHNMAQELRRLGPTGRRSLAQSGAAWVKQMRQNGQLTTAQARDANDNIVKSFAAMGQRVRIVNGQVLFGSKKEWSGIEDALGTHAESARQRVTDSFTAIQRQAVGSLTAMGYSRAQARSLVSGFEKGIVNPGDVGKNGLTPKAMTSAGNRNKQGANVRAPRARGGIIPGHGLADRVPVGDRHVAAPGEGWIANRHTMRRLDRMLGAFGTDFRSEVQNEKAPHGAPLRDDHGIMPDADARALGGRVLFARGGRKRRGGDSSAGSGLSSAIGGVVANVTGGGGSAGNLAAMVAKANEIDRHHYPYRWGGGHDPNFTAPYDCSGAVSSVLHAGGKLGSPLTSGAMTTLGRAGPGDVTLYANPGHVYMSMMGRFFGTSSANPGGGAGWFHGGARPGFTVRNIPVTGGAKGMFGPNALGGGGGQQISLRAPRSGMHGVPGALADRASSLYAHGLEGKINRHLATTTGGAGGGDLSGFAGGGNARANQALGRRMMMAMGWGPDQWPSLRALWMRESGWNQNARNPSSGAQGIPQALGHGNIGSDPASQIAWGLRYIKGRYGSPAAAMGHERSAGWYGPQLGGHPGGADLTARRPTVIGVGDHPRGEDVTVRPRPLGPGRHPSGAHGGGRGRGHVAGLSVTIQQMHVNYRGRGDIRRVVRDEIGQAITELADELEGGVATDEDAVLR